MGEVTDEDRKLWEYVVTHEKVHGLLAIADYRKSTKPLSFGAQRANDEATGYGQEDFDQVCRVCGRIEEVCAMSTWRHVFEPRGRVYKPATAGDVSRGERK